MFLPVLETNQFQENLEVLISSLNRGYLSNGIRTIAPRGKLPPDRVGAWVKVRVSFRFGGNQTIAPEENCPRLGLEFGLDLVLGLGANFLGGNCPRTLFNRLNYRTHSEVFVLFLGLYMHITGMRNVIEFQLCVNTNTNV